MLLEEEPVSIPSPKSSRHVKSTQTRCPIPPSSTAKTSNSSSSKASDATCASDSFTSPRCAFAMRAASNISSGTSKASTPICSANAAPMTCSALRMRAATRVGPPSQAATMFSAGIIVQSPNSSKIHWTLPAIERALACPSAVDTFTARPTSCPSTNNFSPPSMMRSSPQMRSTPSLRAAPASSQTCMPVIASNGLSRLAPSLQLEAAGAGGKPTQE
mmetsp:Transcript_66647/g.159297  ORF Transcript_66647/g.159297 Transcript_66647/m.159297 type:complete len:217 (-) Transcript_66647:81-731(-)